MKVDNLDILIFKTREEMGAASGAKAAEKIRELQKNQDYVNIIFASAPSQNEFLAALSVAEGINWEKINAFHMDEYVGLPADAPQNFGNFLKVNLFDKVDVNKVFYINGNAPDIEEECKRYAKLLTEYPTDIVCLGIGENGHIAFNDPHVADFNDPLLVKKVALDLASRQQQVNDKCFESLEEVPEDAITLTIPSLLKAKHGYCIVPGEKKAQAILNTVAEDISEQFPSTILRKHHGITLFIDKDSSGKLGEISSYSQA
ncbi:6-phosphogluconolactonase [Dyadobacter psychrotolerans]|uniref:Glucosamine-6-phosphate deaminase n=1 Tax=Dyadobacter psychrotolerans TaxID=2541721 RepID=A0A4R5DFR1_9BACT|nr:glucosamine-6-phosphate deaminase [Dyadobacter psychrotolerans]TDE12812.1 glucosamine-6-phosphate deaminase [Dyadobacter psychrotolerans]